MPSALRAVLVLVRAVFAVTLVGAFGVLLLAASLGGVDGELLGWVLYGALPGTAGLLLGRRAGTGGVWILRGLLAVQGWFIAGALATLGGGDGRGVTQLLIPVVVVVLLCRPASRAWFRLSWERRVPPRPFRVARMIKWRTEGGQTTTEYVGLVLIVAAIIGALVVSGVGGQVVGGLRAAVCAVTGAACGSGPGGGDPGSVDPGSVDSGGVQADGDVQRGDGPQDQEGPQDQDEPQDQRTDGDGEGTTDGDNGGGDDPDHGGNGDKDDESCTSGIGAFLSCGARQVGGFFEGVVVDGLWGDITGTFETILHPVKAWEGIKEYGESLGRQWLEDTAGAARKWADGDWFGALVDWGGASLGTGITVLDDVFVGDDVRDMWNRGDQGQAIGTVLWNVGSLFIPGYGEAKLVGKLGTLGKLGKLGELGELAQKASEAAARARKAADAGDVEAAEAAAREARRHADEAAEKAGVGGCTFSAPPAPRLRGVPGAGTGVVAGAAPAAVPVRFLADPCDGDDPDKTEAARQADRDADAAERAAADAERRQQDKNGPKEWPPPTPGDKNDPRNYTPPDWADDLNDPRLGDADGGDGTWRSRNRNPEPTWANEAWLRYQEQISGSVRGKEYVVPHPEPGRRPVEFDGWDSRRQTFLEAKLGYESYLVKQDGKPTAQLTESGKAKFLAEARGQVAASGGRAIEWHFSDPLVAQAARIAFLDADLPVKVIHTPQKRPISGPMKPTS
ncbi:Tox-REase-5 domain-containing protein [Streptomyces sp. NPDC047928]|uniref:Tox-REase-5 domain-containing protein n=1 Tax=unclassified Streptomyces TaxID=2593676 RepID=UPI003721066F